MIHDPDIRDDQLFVGLDLSLTSTGAAFAWRKGPDVIWDIRVHKPPKLCRGADRLRWLRDIVMADIAVHMGVLVTDIPMNHQTLVVVEGYAAQAKYQAHQIGELGGVIRLALLEADVPFMAVAPTVLKKFVTGKGNAPKSVVLKYLLSYFGIDVDNDDAGDALGLALLGAYLVGGLGDLTKTRKDAFDKIELPDTANHMMPRILPLEVPVRRRLRPHERR